MKCHHPRCPPTRNPLWICTSTVTRRCIRPTLLFCQPKQDWRKSKCRYVSVALVFLVKLPNCWPSTNNIPSVKRKRIGFFRQLNKQVWNVFRPLPASTFRCCALRFRLVNQPKNTKDNYIRFDHSNLEFSRFDFHWGKIERGVFTLWPVFPLIQFIGNCPVSQD